MSLYVNHGILFAQSEGIIYIYCTNLRQDELSLASGRFQTYTAEPQEYVVPVNRTRSHVTASLDWIEEFEAGPWSFAQDAMGAHFTFSDLSEAVQFKLTLMDHAH